MGEQVKLVSDLHTVRTPYTGLSIKTYITMLNFVDIDEVPDDFRSTYRGIDFVIEYDDLVEKTGESLEQCVKNIEHLVYLGYVLVVDDQYPKYIKYQLDEILDDSVFMERVRIYKLTHKRTGTRRYKIQ